METKILSKNKNPFLNREEIVMEIKSKSAPSMEAVKDSVGKSKDLIVVKNISSNFGNQTFTANFVVYDSVESKDRTEVIPRKVRKKAAEDKKKADEEAKAKAAAEAVAAKEAASKPAEAAKQ